MAREVPKRSLAMTLQANTTPLAYRSPEGTLHSRHYDYAGTGNHRSDLGR